MSRTDPRVTEVGHNRPTRENIWDVKEAATSWEDDAADEEVWAPVDLGGFPAGIELIGVCLRVVRKDKEILVLQFLSFVLAMAFLAMFIIAIEPSLDEEAFASEAESLGFLIKLFPYYVIAIATVTYFRAAAVGCAMIRLRGGSPTIVDGLSLANKRIWRIIGWAVFAAIVGVVLAALNRRSKGAGRYITKAAEVAWGIATYFVVPVLVYEEKGALDAVTRSASIVKRTWRESLAGNFGMGAVFLGLGLLGIFPLIVASAIGGLLFGIVVFVVYLVALGIVAEAAGCVLLAALYMMATTGRRPEGFDSDESWFEMKNAFERIELRRPARSEDVEVMADRLFAFARR